MTEKSRQDHKPPSHGHDAGPRDRHAAESDRLSRFFSLASRPQGDLRRRGRWLRWALPVFTVILLAAMVLWPMINDKTTSVMLSYSDLQASGEEIRMQGARYAGVDAGKRPFEISADLAVQQGVKATEAVLTGVSAMIEVADDDRVTVTGGRGVYNRDQRNLALDGGIRLDSTSGYQIATEQAEVDISSGIATGRSGVAGSSPFGSFSADGFVLHARDRTLELEGRVRVHLEPGRDEGATTQDAPPDNSE